MVSSAPIRNTPPASKSMGFIANALKRKDSFIQWIAMTGILLLSMRSLGQKYRLHDLREDTYQLQEEKKILDSRINHVKTSLWAEAQRDTTGVFADRLRNLFGTE